MLTIGACAVHPETHLIRRDGEDIRVPHKVMATLVCLIAHEGRVVTKAQLIEEVWDGAFTSDEVISTTIYELRKALGDDARRPRYVETIRKSGYRLMAEVRVEASAARAPRATPDMPPDRNGTSVAKHRSRRHLLVTASLAAVVVTALGVGQLRDRQPGTAEALATQPIPVEACEAYLEGHQYFELGTKSGLEKAVHAFQRATEIDSTLGMAYAALAECFTTGDWGLLGLDWTRAHARARDAAQRALEIDGNDPLAQASLASIRFFHEWDWARAESEFVSCLSITSCSPGAGSRQYASFLSAMGRHDESIAILRELISRDPASLRVRVELARSYYFARRFDVAFEQASSILERHPNEPILHELLGDIHVALGRDTEAARAYRRALLLSSIATGAEDDQPAGGSSVQDERIARERRRVEDGASPVRLARLLAQAGLSEEAVSWLSRALDERRSDVVWINEDPAFDSIRSRPAFGACLGRLQLST